MNMTEINLIKPFSQDFDENLGDSINKEKAREKSKHYENKESVKKTCPEERNLPWFFLYICLLFFCSRFALDSSSVAIDSLLKQGEPEKNELIFFTYYVSCIPRIIFSVCSGYFADYDGVRSTTYYSTCVFFLGNFLIVSSICKQGDDSGAIQDRPAFNYYMVGRIISEVGFTTLYVILLREVLFVFYNRKLGLKFTCLVAIFSSIEIGTTLLLSLGTETHIIAALSFGSSVLTIIFGILFTKKIPKNPRSFDRPIVKATCGTELNNIINSRFFLISLNWGILISVFTIWSLCLDRGFFYKAMLPSLLDDIYDFSYFFPKLIPYFGIVFAVILLSGFKIYKMRSKTPFLILSSFIAGMSSWALLVLLENNQADDNLKRWTFFAILFIMGTGFGIQMIIGFTCIPPLNEIYYWGLSAGFYYAMENIMCFVLYNVFKKLILESNKVYIKKNEDETVDNQNLRILIAITSLLITITTVLYVLVEYLDSNIRKERAKEQKQESLYVNLDQTDYLACGKLAD